nr:MAG TPA: type VI secretion protein [Caudoviricetes sp.]
MLLTSAFLMCLMGCESKQEVVNKYDKIPSYLLEVPLIADRNVTNQGDAGVLLIDVYSGYEKCIGQLEDIKKYETKRDKQ